MTSPSLLQELAALDVVVSVRDGHLDVNAPAALYTPELEATIKANKAMLVAALTSGQRLPLEQNVVFVDFETRSLVRLDEVGGRKYAGDASTEVICAVFELPDGSTDSWSAGQEFPGGVANEIRAGSAVAAHNAFGFDRFIWQRLGWPEPAAWIDTMQLARAAGLPGALDDAAHAVLGRNKDSAGRKITLALSRPDPQTNRMRPIDAVTRERVLGYCEADVVLTADLWSAELSSFLHTDNATRAVDRVINERGFAFDGALATAIMAVERDLAEQSRMAAAVPPTLLGSPAQLKGWLERAGLRVANVRAETIEALLDDPDVPDDVRRVLTARLASAGIASRKLRRAVAWQSPDGRLRDTLVYHAAHTGRWSGKGFQPQNLPRIPKSLETDTAIAAVLDHDIGALARLAAKAGVRTEEALGACLRPCIIAPPALLLAPVDYRQIEARALLWHAGDEQGLDVFRQDIDVYSEEAAHLFGVSNDAIEYPQRQFGKAMTLGAGYGMGGARFSAYGESCGIDWSSSKFTPGEVIEAWRDRHPFVAGWATGETFNGHIVRRGGLWRDVEAAARRALEEQRRSEIGRCEWESWRGSLVCNLPSGRRLFYREARIEPVTTPWGEKHGITYAQRGGRIKTWGGKLVENIVQGTCRDLLADALLRLERAGFPVVLHVHDEVVCEVSAQESLAHIETIVKTVPPWARGLPIDVEGYVARRYGVKLP